MLRKNISRNNRKIQKKNNYKGQINILLSENNGILHIDGISTEQIAKDFGTPCYVMSEDHIRNTCRLYKNAFDKFYEGKGMPLYASKAFSACEIYRIVKEEGGTDG